MRGCWDGRSGQSDRLRQRATGLVELGPQLRSQQDLHDLSQLREVVGLDVARSVPMD